MCPNPSPGPTNWRTSLDFTPKYIGCFGNWTYHIKPTNYRSNCGSISTWGSNESKRITNWWRRWRKQWDHYWGTKYHIYWGIKITINYIPKNKKWRTDSNHRWIERIRGEIWCNWWGSSRNPIYRTNCIIGIFRLWTINPLPLQLLLLEPDYKYHIPGGSSMGYRFVKSTVGKCIIGASMILHMLLMYKIWEYGE